MGHVQAGPVSATGSDPHLSGRQHRGARTGRRPLNRRRVGALGEQLAAGFLDRQGGIILARNLRVGRGEIDLVARLGAELVAVEVKTMVEGGSTLDAPSEWFTPRKAAQVRHLASRLRPPIRRVDLIAVVLRSGGADIRWIPRVA